MMGWSPSGANYYLECGWIDVGTWYLMSEIHPTGTGVCDCGVGGCDIGRKGGSTARTRLKKVFTAIAHSRFRLSLAPTHPSQQKFIPIFFLVSSRAGRMSARGTDIVAARLALPDLVVALFLLCPGPTPWLCAEQNPPETHLPLISNINLLMRRLYLVHSLGVRQPVALSRLPPPVVADAAMLIIFSSAMEARIL